jgi:hypothetical protein
VLSTALLAVLLLPVTSSPICGQSLTTLFATDNNFAGNTFDVVASNPVTLTGFAINLSNPGSTSQIDIYYRIGTAVGNESSPSGWILLGSDSSVVSNGVNVPTPVNIGGLALVVGQVYGFYVDVASYPSANLQYTNGGPTVYSNADLSLTTNNGKGNPAFSGGNFFPRQWNGTIFYQICDADGVIDAGEECDDGGISPGDGCDATCRIEPCWSCTGGPSTCTHLAGGAPCADDGSECTADVCDGAGSCDHPALSSGTPCSDDGSLCTGDVCDGAGTCTHPSAVDCSLVSQCHEPGTCEPSTGACTYCPVGYTVGGGGCQKTYPIDVSLLDNLPTDCGGDRYNGCSGAFGFHWTDTGDGSVGPVLGADLRIEAGVSCTGAARSVLLNGNPVGSYSPGGTCACPTANAPRLLNGIDVSSYVKGGANAVLTDNPGNCEGLSDDGSGSYAVVTVTYQPPTAPVLPDGSSCTDFLYCNGIDTCSSGNCDQHAGDPCIGGGECNATCNEAADNCFDLPPTPCTSDSNPCTVDQCDGAGACGHPAGNAGAECRPDGGQCDVAEQCDGSSPTCPTDGFESSGIGCNDGSICTQTDQCNGSGTCVGSNPQDCNDGSICTADSCDPVNGCEHDPQLATGCAAADSSLLILQQNGGSGDKQLFKWGKGDALTQTQLGDPTGTTEYAICIFNGPTNDVLESFTVPAADGKWSALGTSGYKYKDSNGTNGGLTKLLLKGSTTPGKSKVLLKGKGGNLPDPGLANLPLPVTAQVINPDTGVCVEAVFDTGDVKKNTNTLFKAKAQQ